MTWRYPDLDKDFQSGAHRLWIQLRMQMNQALAIISLVLLVLSYAACPLAVSCSNVVGFEQHGGVSVPIRGRPFKEGSVIVVSWAFNACGGFVLSVVFGGIQTLHSCLDWRAVQAFAPAGIGWAFADAFEVLAVAHLDPSTYGVISQARLCGTACLCWAFRGMTQTRLQWGMLLGLTLVCMAYCMVPDDAALNKLNKEMLFRWRLKRAELKIDSYDSWRRNVDIQSDADNAANFEYALGIFFALSKVALSVISSVYGESRFKSKIASSGSKPPALYVQMAQISISSAVAAMVGYCVICRFEGEDVRGFFIGRDGCWDRRTVFVALMYCSREWLSNIVVKRFDSVVKNICNAAALLVTYAYSVFFQEKPFSVLKALLLVAVVTEVLNYVQTRRVPSARVVDEQAPAKIPVWEYTALTPRNGGGCERSRTMA